ncbi:MAG: fumarylacetoacetate hydrolase family protein [Pseudolabrys sp.]|nr:fumarylacetoacetate hydrolase family protein [Pseudolabrys sp.]
MKLVTFKNAAGEERIGAVRGDLKSIADFKAGASALGIDPGPAFNSMVALMEAGEAGLAAARQVAEFASTPRGAAAVVDMASARLLAPVPVPQQMRDFLAFELHYRQARARALKIRASTYPDPVKAEQELAGSDEFKIPPVWYEQPIYYKGNRFSVIGPEADILWPRYSKKLDYELEFGVFIGKRGKNISRENAKSHIFGYCIFNDMSARDAQYKEYPGRLGPAKGKDFDTGNVMGPWLVTADELTDPYNLPMTVRVNGEVWGQGNSATIHHKFEDMIVHASNEEVLQPGEFLGSGTVGNGCGLELDRWIKPGDTIELEVGGLGTLRNRVVAQD